MCHASWGHCAPHSSVEHPEFGQGHRHGGWREYFMRGGGGRHGGGGPGEDADSGGFGVRRPLRFLAYKLGLDEKQVTELARILNELKTERAQAAVDDRRTLAEFADAMAGDAFDVGKATNAGERRVASATRLRDAVARSLQQVHAVLNAEQRAKLAYLIRTGVLAM